MLSREDFAIVPQGTKITSFQKVMEIVTGPYENIEEVTEVLTQDILVCLTYVGMKDRTPIAAWENGKGWTRQVDKLSYYKAPMMMAGEDYNDYISRVTGNNPNKLKMKF